MSRSLSLVLSLACILAAVSTVHAQDISAGEKVFKKCGACHAVGKGAGNKVGPHLNDLLGRKAGSVEGYRYSKQMADAGDGGLVWDDESVAAFLANPRQTVKGTKMSFGGLKNDQELANVIAYLKTFSADQQDEPEKAEVPQEQAPVASAEPKASGEELAKQELLAREVPVPTHGVLHLGREAMQEEIAAWDIDVRPDGLGLPVGKGTVADGESIYAEQCATCHGVFGEGAGRWPVLAGGQGTLTADRPEKTIGSYWPYLSTVYDYVHRAMPFGDARSLSSDDVYALTAYLLFLNDIVLEEDFELSNENFTEIRLPNEENFFMDDREQEVHSAAGQQPCMKDCIAGKAKVTMRARVLDVTPDNDDDEGGGIE